MNLENHGRNGRQVLVVADSMQNFLSEVTSLLEEDTLRLQFGEICFSQQDCLCVLFPAEAPSPPWRLCQDPDRLKVKIFFWSKKNFRAQIEGLGGRGGGNAPSLRHCIDILGVSHICSLVNRRAQNQVRENSSRISGVLTFRSVCSRNVFLVLVVIVVRRVHARIARRRQNAQLTTESLKEAQHVTRDIKWDTGLICSKQLKMTTTNMLWHTCGFKASATQILGNYFLQAKLRLLSWICSCQNQCNYFCSCQQRRYTTRWAKCHPALTCEWGRIELFQYRHLRPGDAMSLHPCPFPSCPCVFWIYPSP